MTLSSAVLGMILAAVVQDAAADEKKQKEEEAKAKIAEFRKELKKCKTAGDICLAIQTLGSVQHPKILAELQTWLSRPESEICSAAAEQIGKYAKDRVAAEILLATAKSRKDADGIISCLRFIGDIGYRPIAPQLVPFFRNKSVNVAKEAVDSLGKLGSAASIDPLIKLARELEEVPEGQWGGGVNLPMPGGIGGNLPGGPAGEGSPQNDMLSRKRVLLDPVFRALQQITGERWRSHKEWTEWWRKNRATFKEKSD